MNETMVTVVGNLTQNPRVLEFEHGRKMTSFGIAVNETRCDAEGTWTTIRTTYYDVKAWRRLGENAATSLRKGDRVVVLGKLLVEQYVAKTGEQRTGLGLEARALGPDLTYASTQLVPATTKMHGSDDASAESGAESSVESGDAVDDGSDDAGPSHPDIDLVDGVRVTPEGEVIGV